MLHHPSSLEWASTTPTQHHQQQQHLLQKTPSRNSRTPLSLAPPVLKRPLCVENDRSCLGTLYIQRTEEMEPFWDQIWESCPDVLVGEEDVGIPRHTKWTQVGSTPFQAQVELCTLFHPSLQGLVFPLRNGLELRVQGTPGLSPSNRLRMHLQLCLMQRRVTVVLDLDHTLVHATSNFDESVSDHGLSQSPSSEDLHVLELHHPASPSSSTNSVGGPSAPSLTSLMPMDSLRFLEEDEDSPPSTPRSKRPGTPPSCESLPPLWGFFANVSSYDPSFTAVGGSPAAGNGSKSSLPNASLGTGAAVNSTAVVVADSCYSSPPIDEGSSMCALPSSAVASGADEASGAERYPSPLPASSSTAGHCAKETILVKVRPGARELISWLKSMSGCVDVVVCSAGVRAYVEAVVNLFDGQRQLIKHVFAREDLRQSQHPLHTSSSIKDLSSLGLPLSIHSTIILDDRPDVWIQHHNVLRVEPFVHFECDKDACEAAVAACMHSGMVGSGYAGSMQEALSLLSQFVAAWKHADRPDCFSWVSFMDRWSNCPSPSANHANAFPVSPSCFAPLFAPLAQQQQQQQQHHQQQQQLVHSKSCGAESWDSIAFSSFLGGHHGSAGIGGGVSGGAFLSSHSNSPFPFLSPVLEGGLMRPVPSVSDMDGLWWSSTSTQ